MRIEVWVKSIYIESSVYIDYLKEKFGTNN